MGPPTTAYVGTRLATSAGYLRSRLYRAPDALERFKKGRRIVVPETDDPVLKKLDELQIRVGFPRVTTLRGYTPKSEEKRAIETAKGREWYEALALLQGRPGFPTIYGPALRVMRKQFVERSDWSAGNP
jgi:hypothetical protein